MKRLEFYGFSALIISERRTNYKAETQYLNIIFKFKIFSCPRKTLML